MVDTFDILDGDVPLDTLTKTEAVEAYGDAYLREECARYEDEPFLYWVSSDEIYSAAEKLFGTEFLKFLDGKIRRDPFKSWTSDRILRKKPVRVRKDGKAYKSDLETRKRELTTKYLT